MQMLCDFCASDDKVVKSYACPFTAFDLVINNERFIGNSIGNWDACQTCANLIDQDKWDELAQRYMDTANYPPEVRKLNRLAVRHLHDTFRRLRLKTN